jgi:hypothetical protein
MTRPASVFTRRRFHRIFAGAVLFGRRLLRAADDSRLTWEASPDTASGTVRRYRADAEVTVLSVPLLRRRGVGDGSAGWCDSAEDGAVVRSLEFTGRSVPERSGGLNRFGFIQELSRTGAGTYAEAMYFGLMTTSPEETVADARKSLHATSREASYSAIEGHLAAGSIETAGTRFIAPSPGSPAEQNELIDRARRALLEAPRKKSNLGSAESTPQPFLHALARMLSHAGSSEARYAYNGRFYHLRVEKAPDPKAAAAFQELRLIGDNAEVTRISGYLSREEGGKPIEFRLWIEQGVPRPLPLRIEYQPKSYLRLTFEAQA